MSSPLYTWHCLDFKTFIFDCFRKSFFTNHEIVLSSNLPRICNHWPVYLKRMTSISKVWKKFSLFYQLHHNVSSIWFSRTSWKGQTLCLYVVDDVVTQSIFSIVISRSHSIWPVAFSLCFVNVVRIHWMSRSYTLMFQWRLWNICTVPCAWSTNPNLLFFSRFCWLLHTFYQSGRQVNIA